MLRTLFAFTLLLTTPMAAAVLQDISVQGDHGELEVILKADGPASFKASALHNPERILVTVKGATLKGSPLDKSAAWGQGILKRIRLVDKGEEECWAVLDLEEAASFSAMNSADGIDLSIKSKSGVKPEGPKIKAKKAKSVKKEPVPEATAPPAAATAPPADPAPVAPLQGALAKLPLINLMIFDLNVNYQGRHYDRYPCANLIYTANDAFPLEREFSTVLVFHHGFGSFSGSARLLDPQGQILAMDAETFNFKLHNALGDAMIELPWKVLFKEKGVYKLVLALNGTDVMFHEFYVGHNTDTLPEPAVK